MILGDCKPESDELKDGELHNKKVEHAVRAFMCNKHEGRCTCKGPFKIQPINLDRFNQPVFASQDISLNGSDPNQSLSDLESIN